MAGPAAGSAAAMAVMLPLVVVSPILRGMGRTPRVPEIARLGVPAVLAVMMLGISLQWDRFGRWLNMPDSAASLGEGVAGILLCLSVAKLIIRLIEVFWWRSWFERHSGFPTPRLLIDLVNMVVWLLTGLVIAATVFNQPVTGLLATSGVFVAVVGFALKGMITDLFSGVAISIERTFQIGDWVEVEGITGKVVEITWRATSLLTIENITITIPNGRLSSISFRNYSRPEASYRDAVTLTFDYSVSGDRIERLLLSAANQVPEVAGQPKKPQARISRHTEYGVQWQLQYWVPDYQTGLRLRYDVHRNILRNLHFAGIAMPAGRWEYRADRNAEFDREMSVLEFLRRIALFQSLNDEELLEVALRAQTRLCLSGQPVVRQGDPGESLFVVKEGLLSVKMAGPNGGEARQIARLTPGSFFGEMSLLTGSPRSATVVPAVDSVVFEITKDVIEPLIQRRSDIAAIMSAFLAERQTASSSLASDNAAVAPPASANDHDGLAQQFLGRILTFFGLAREPEARPAAVAKAIEAKPAAAPQPEAPKPEVSVPADAPSAPPKANARTRRRRRSRTRSKKS